MSIDKNHSEQFERYLNGQMSPEEAHAFEREVLDDPFAQEALEGYETQGAEAIHDVKKLRSKVVAKRNSFSFMRIAAAVALLIMGSFTVYFFINQVENDQLAMEKESPKEMTQQPTPDTIRRSIPENTSKEEAIKPTEQVADKPKQIAEVSPKIVKTPKPETVKEEEPAEEIDNQGAGMMADNAVQDDDDFMLVEADEVIAEELVAAEIELDAEEDLEEVVIEPDLGQARTKKTATASEAAKPLALRSRSAERSVQPPDDSLEKSDPKSVVGDSLYLKYLNENLIYPNEARENEIEGIVLLEVTISSSGKIKSINILESLGYGCDEEAIRLVNEGPEWNPAAEDGESIEDTIEVEVKFKLRR